MKTLLVSSCVLLLTLCAAAQSQSALDHSKVASAAVTQTQAKLASMITVNINGMNCTTAAGTNQFAADAWSWGASNPITINVGGGAGAGKVSLSSINLMKRFDACSPVLFESVSAGSHFSGATITQSDLQGNALLVVTLNTVYVESWQLSGTTSDAAPSESVSLAFSKVCIKDPSTSAQTCYDQATGKIN